MFALSTQTNIQNLSALLVYKQALNIQCMSVCDYETERKLIKENRGIIGNNERES